jgi:Tfp pilus assembly protein PilF
MEVAMIASLGRTTLRLLLGLATVAPVALLSGGCSDVITYSYRSREEGMRRFAEKSYSDAAGAFRNAIRQEPLDYRSHYYLGVCYDEMQQHQQAFQEYKAALGVMATTVEGKFDD